VDIHIATFHLPYLKWFKENGYETYVAANGDADIPYCDRKIHIDIRRSPFRGANLSAYKQLAALLKETRFDLIHCHTPMGGVLTRLAARKYRKMGTSVLYTAHGFHFYKGGPRLNYLLYYPIEKCLSHITDGLITINSEDFDTAKNKFCAKRTFLSHGVGYDDTRFFTHDQTDKTRYRKEYGYAEDDLLLIYVAELNKNKNQRFLMDTLKHVQEWRIKDKQQGKKRSRIKLLLVGGDSLDGACQRYAQEIGVGEDVDFLGQRDDADRLIPMCDIAVCSSIREGLPVNVMESLACGLPTVATNVRGHRDLIESGKNGYLADIGDTAGFAHKITSLIENADLREQMSRAAVASIEPYSITNVIGPMIEIYENFL
jgi:glycosyltransferase EpsD